MINPLSLYEMRNDQRLTDAMQQFLSLKGTSSSKKSKQDGIIIAIVLIIIIIIITALSLSLSLT